MKSSKDISTYLELSDKRLVSSIMNFLRTMKEEKLLCGLYVGNDLISSIKVPVVRVKYNVVRLGGVHLESLIKDLKFLGYKCSRIYECTGAYGDDKFLPNTFYFHVNYNLTFKEKVMYFICKYIFKREIF